MAADESFDASTAAAKEKFATVRQAAAGRVWRLSSCGA